MRRKLLFDLNRRFKIIRVATCSEVTLFLVDSLSPDTVQIVKGDEFSLDRKNDCLAAFRLFFPTPVSSAPLKVGDKPSSIMDTHFWQYPAITEKIALEKHINETARVGWDERSKKTVQTYFGLPWATYIDKRSIPEVVLSVFGTRFLGYRYLAREWSLKWGREVRVHTVCQHIDWQRMLLLWQSLGITDVHLSHCETNSCDIAYKYGIRIHSWPLAAVNIVNRGRNQGLSVGKSLHDKRYLASFVGSYLPSHRSDIRLRIHSEAITDGGEDIFVELSREWHFNSQVYQEQVKGQLMSATQMSKERLSTENYNSVLSDSIFSICPEGSGPNTIRLWESLAVGSIPVVIVENWVWPSIPDNELSWEDCVIHISREEICGLFHRLRQMKKNELDKLIKMQVAAMSVYKAFHRKRCF